MGFCSLKSSNNLGSRRLRQGLNRGARKGGGAWPARRGGDFRSPRKPAGTAPGNRGLPVKARSRPKNQHKKWKLWNDNPAEAAKDSGRLHLNYVQTGLGLRKANGIAVKLGCYLPSIAEKHLEILGIYEWSNDVAKSL